MPNWMQKWRLNDGPENVYAPNCDLELIKDVSGERTVYTVKRTDKAAQWNNTWLVPRGSAELPWPGQPLMAWDPVHEYIYDKRIHQALRFADANTARLEGEIEVGGKKELVIFFVAEKAAVGAQGNEDVLVIRSRMKSLLDIGMSQDGTAHGNPK